MINLEKLLLCWCLTFHVAICGKRTPRQLGLSLLNLLPPVNDPRPCVVPGGRRGTCSLPNDCAIVGGQAALGNCPNGRQICCFISTTCGGSVYTNNTYFRLHPSGAGRGEGGAGEEESSFDGEGTCAVRVHKMDNSICQFRLDFRKMELSPPDHGNCHNDVFEVSGQNPESFVPPLCGTNTGQHVYLEVSAVRGPVNLRLTTVGNFRRRLDVHITQISCTSMSKAPSGCLQYHTGTRGTLRSFNFPPQGESKEGYLNNLNYTICIRKESSYCDVTYKARKEDYPTFDLSSVHVVAGQPGVGIHDCPNDYVLLGGVRRCGRRLSSGTCNSDPLKDSYVTDGLSGPATVHVVSDGSDVGGGFRLQYHLNPC